MFLLQLLNLNGDLNGGGIPRCERQKKGKEDGLREKTMRNELSERRFHWGLIEKDSQDEQEEDEEEDDEDELTFFHFFFFFFSVKME